MRLVQRASRNPKLVEEMHFFGKNASIDRGLGERLLAATCAGEYRTMMLRGRWRNERERLIDLIRKHGEPIR